MKIPERMTVRVRLANGESVPDLLVQMKVTAGSKNPYYIEFPKTDATGTAVLTRDDFIGQFKDHWGAGLMDYNGTPESSNPDVEIRLYDPTPVIQNPQISLAWPLLSYERTKWSSRREEYDYRVSSRNSAFALAPLSVNLETTPTIDLVVDPLQ